MGTRLGKWLYWLALVWWAAVLWLLPWPARAAPLVLSARPLATVAAADGLALDDRGVPWLLERDAAALVSLQGARWQLPTQAAELVAFCPHGPVMVERLGSGVLWQLDARGDWRRQPLPLPPQAELARPAAGALSGLWVRDGVVVVEWLHRWTQRVAYCGRPSQPLHEALQLGRPGWHGEHIQLRRNPVGDLLLTVERPGQPLLPLQLRLAFAVQSVLDLAPLPNGQLALLVADDAATTWLVRLHPSGRLLGLQALPETDALHLPLQTLVASPTGALWWLRRTGGSSALHAVHPREF